MMEPETPQQERLHIAQELRLSEKDMKLLQGVYSEDRWQVASAALKAFTSPLRWGRLLTADALSASTWQQRISHCLTTLQRFNMPLPENPQLTSSTGTQVLDGSFVTDFTEWIDGRINEVQEDVDLTYNLLRLYSIGALTHKNLSAMGFDNPRGLSIQLSVLVEKLVDQEDPDIIGRINEIQEIMLIHARRNRRLIFGFTALAIPLTLAATPILGESIAAIITGTKFILPLIKGTTVALLLGIDLSYLSLARVSSVILDKLNIKRGEIDETLETTEAAEPDQKRLKVLFNLVLSKAGDLIQRVWRKIPRLSISITEVPRHFDDDIGFGVEISDYEDLINEQRLSDDEVMGLIERQERDYLLNFIGPKALRNYDRTDTAQQQILTSTIQSLVPSYIRIKIAYVKGDLEDDAIDNFLPLVANSIAPITSDELEGELNPRFVEIVRRYKSGEFLSDGETIQVSDALLRLWFGETLYNALYPLEVSIS